jgi:hypothetical protein
MNSLQEWGPVAVIVGGYIIGLYFQARSIAHLDTRISDLRVHMDKRIDDVRDLLRAEIRVVEEKVNKLTANFDLMMGKLIELDNRLTRVEERLEKGK